MKKNFADGFIQGNYFVTVKDNRATIAPVSNFRGATDAALLSIHTQAICCEEDTFDIGEAFKLCFERYCDNYDKGSWVEIVSGEQCYTLLADKAVEFAKRNRSKYDEILVHWREGFSPIAGHRGTIVDVMDKYVLVKINKNYYIMDKRGVKRV